MRRFNSLNVSDVVLLAISLLLLLSVDVLRGVAGGFFLLLTAFGRFRLPTRIIYEGLNKFAVLYAIFLYAYIFLSQVGDGNLIVFFTLTMICIVGYIKLGIYWVLALICLALSYFKRDYGDHGVSLSETDWSIVIDVGLYFAIYVFFIENFSNSRLPLKITVSKERLYSVMVFSIIALHISNYLYAGIAKFLLNLDFSWILNETQNIFYASFILGQNPFFDLLGLEYTVNLFETVNKFYPIIIIVNAAVLIFQLLSPFGLYGVRPVFFLLILFDVFHIAIFLASGIFFYKWIVLNGLLMMLVLNKDIIEIFRVSFDGAVKRIFISYTMAVACFFVTYIPMLGWYDSNAIVKNEVYAVIDGDRLALPSNAFKKYSVTFAQHRVSENAFPSGAYGATRVFDNTKFECEGLVDNFRSNHVKRSVDLTAFFAEIKDYLIKSTFDSYRFDYYPHHIWSNFSSGSLSESQLNRIQGFEVVSNLFCIDHDGRIHENLIGKYYYDAE